MKNDLVTVKNVLFILEQAEKRKITHEEIANIFNCTQEAITTRIKRGSEIKATELRLITKKYPNSKTQLLNKLGFDMPDAVEIVYYDNPKLTNIIKNPAITSIWLDRELVHNKWHKNEKDLRTISMPGDNMNGGIDPIFNGDMLIIDISSTDVQRSGIYAFTTRGETKLFVNILRQRVNGDVEFSHWNPNYDLSVRSAEELKQLDFKIIGRMIKPMELFHD